MQAILISTVLSTHHDNDRTALMCFPELLITHQTKWRRPRQHKGEGHDVIMSLSCLRRGLSD